ncbi:hypothetical protein MS2017_2001 [Bathymodiolus thermophilus thioautotrophic gill symbiont]|uniref:Uncharacterized protein n=1 Tax=Bathymodiolus thermophilus thioautotrophic gill symbiont TaxID=2360 RepID=A0A3G3IPP1_9GAMM|nr:hypothetical protein [Bathymodiolus thermophilus thioautotrophic gill symbiont]AYQ57659.1 hypothetical protein MS2017_2001 [Bathymodiolus thermophilus thioautotrophic gill symbiont]
MQILIISIILFNLKSQSNGVKPYWFLLVRRILAQVLAYFDTQVLHFLGVHLIKRIIATLSLRIFSVLRSEKTRGRCYA